LDNKTLNRLETAVAKSEYVGAGKKLKVTNEVCRPFILLSLSSWEGRENIYATTSLTPASLG
jgi:hypothetical protein